MYLLVLDCPLSHDTEPWTHLRAPFTMDAWFSHSSSEPLASDTWVDIIANEDAPVNKPDRGPLGFGVLPAVREKLKAGFLSSFLMKLYKEEAEASVGYANTAVAHADADDPAMNTLNAAMPDLVAEYWLTMIPDGKRPIVKVSFPAWARYTALTVYDTSGMPIASITSVEVESDQRVAALPEGGYKIDLLHGGEFSGP